MKFTNHNLKCPRCGGQAVKTIEEGRLRYNCYTCGDNGYMKNVQSIIKQYETKVHKS